MLVERGDAAEDYFATPQEVQCLRALKLMLLCMHCNGCMQCVVAGVRCHGGDTWYQQGNQLSNMPFDC